GLVAITSAALLNTEEAIKRIFDIFEQQKIIRDDGNWDMLVHPEIIENIIAAKHVNLEKRLGLQHEVKENAKQRKIKILNHSSLFDKDQPNESNSLYETFEKIYSKNLHKRRFFVFIGDEKEIPVFNSKNIAA
ncbi:830_t:CDS:2, partial [Ambispora leptoticha]